MDSLRPFFYSHQFVVFWGLSDTRMAHVHWTIAQMMENKWLGNV
jgi:hypothetical protein